MAAWRSALDLKAQPGVEYSRGFTVGVRATVGIMITFRVRVWMCSCGGGCARFSVVGVLVRSVGCTRSGGRTGSPRFWVTVAVSDRRVRVRVVMKVVLLSEEVVEVLVLPVQIRPDDPSNIPSLFAVEVSHASPQSVCAKDDAPLNISHIMITPDTFQLERSASNDDAEWNMCSMSVTLDTSHLYMSPLKEDAE